MQRHLKENMSDIEVAFQGVLATSSLILGPEVVGFEKDFSDYLSIKHCVSVANGTDALEISLRALGASRSSRIGLVGNAGGYARTAIELIGAATVYCELDVKTQVMSFEFAKELVSNKQIDYLVVTHLYGQIHPNILEIADICERAGVPLIEDCAQSVGATLEGKHSGTFGTIATFSFYPTKNLGALGDGGAIVSFSDHLSDSARSLRQYGWGNKYEINMKHGRNSRLDELQASFLRAFLPKLDSWNIRRVEIATQYLTRILNAKVELPPFQLASYVAHLFPLFTNRPTDFIDHLNGFGIACSIHYPISDQEQRAWGDISSSGILKQKLTPVSIPMSQYLTDEEVNQIIDVVNSF
jgi:dTDP-4-amino-4,6-dideoxygalactose transaminase